MTTWNFRLKKSRLILRVALVALVVLIWVLVGSLNAAVFLASALVMALLFDYSNLVSFRNFFLFYTLLLFVPSAAYQFPTNPNLALEGLWFALAFVVGYGFWRILSPSQSYLIPYVPMLLHTKNLTWPIMLFLLGRFLLFLNDLRTYGFSGYYSGQALADRIQNYANLAVGGGSTLAGLVAILDGVLSAGLVAALVLHVIQRLTSFKRPNYFLLVVALLCFPLVALERMELLLGVVTLVFVFLADLRLNRLRFSWLRYAVPAIVLLLLATIVPSWIGIQREDRLTSRGQENSFATRAVSMVTGELTPILFYDAVRSNVGGVLEYQYGKTIVLPFVLKVIPRSWYPEKPLNTSGYVMSVVFPDLFDAGFSLAPSIFGDLYMNFGLWGTLLGLFLLGAWSRHLDKLYTLGGVQQLAIPLLAVYFYYSILRNNLSDSFFFLLMAVVIYQVLRWMPTRLWARSSAAKSTKGT
jgi:oligosaccharide repeat unit polymerase